jgi:SAM-dependent methyltransferase
MRELEDVRRLVRDRSPLSPERTEEVLRRRYASLPRRLEFAAQRWRLDEGAVLDVGCSWGHCLVHFGRGSVGIDSAEEQVDFCRALGLDVRLGDANAGVHVPDRSFDFAWVSDVIEHLDAPRLLLRSVGPKLKEDGRLLLFLSVLPRYRLARAASRRRRHGAFDAEAHHYQFTEETARFMVERSGFVVEDVVVPFGPPSLAGVLTSLSPRLYVEARPDPGAVALAARAESRNRNDL